MTSPALTAAGPAAVSTIRRPTGSIPDAVPVSTIPPGSSTRTARPIVAEQLRYSARSPLPLHGTG